MGTGLVGGVAAKLGWQGQPPLKFPGSGLSIVPGAGLIGREDATAGLLYLDTTSAAVAEPYTAFAPGLVAAKTFGKWRNRRSQQDGTLAIMEAYLITAPTAGDANNYWRVVATDSQGTAVVLPISVAAQNFYDLDRSAGVAIISPFPNYDPTLSGSWTSVDTSLAGVFSRITPSQSLVLAGATIHAFTALATAPAVKIGGIPMRATLVDNNGVKLASGIAYSTGALDSAGYETLHCVFDRAIQVVSGTDYFLVFDVGAGPDWAMFGAAGVTSTLVQAGTPASINGHAPGVGAGTGVKLNYSGGGTPGSQGNITGENIVLAWIANGRATGFTWDNVNSGLSVSNGLAASGSWSITGTTSGVAPIKGDLTLSLSSVGAPAAGAAGSDVNARIIILP